MDKGFQDGLTTKWCLALVTFSTAVGQPRVRLSEDECWFEEAFPGVALSGWMVRITWHGTCLVRLRFAVTHLTHLALSINAVNLRRGS